MPISEVWILIDACGCVLVMFGLAYISSLAPNKVKPRQKFWEHLILLARNSSECTLFIYKINAPWHNIEQFVCCLDGNL